MRALLVVGAALPAILGRIAAQQAAPQKLENVYQAQFRVGQLVPAQRMPIPDPPPQYRVVLRADPTPHGPLWAVYAATDQGVPTARYLPVGSRLVVGYGNRWCLAGTPCYYLFRLRSLQPVPTGLPSGRRQADTPPPLLPGRGSPVPGSSQLGIVVPPGTPDDGQPSSVYCRESSLVPLTGKVVQLPGFNCMRLDAGPLKLPDGRVISLESGRILVRKGTRTLAEYDGYAVEILMDQQGTPWALESHGYIR